MLVSTHGIIAQSVSGTPPFSNTKSILLDGVDDFVTMGNVLNTSSTGASSFSMSCWFKTNATTSNYFLMSKARNVSQFDGYQMFIRGNGEIRFFIGRYTGNSSSSPWLYIRTNSNAWNDNNWHNIILTYNGNQSTSGLKVYIDNSLQSLTTLFNNTPSINSTSSEFMIGARGITSSVGGFFDGKIDEASFFNTELSASDVTSIYNGGAPSDISSISGLVSWWRFEGTGTTATDSGSGGNNGTLTNGVTRSTDVP